MPATLLQKVWDAHTVRRLPNGQTQLFIGLHLNHEVTTPQAFAMLRARGWRVRAPGLTGARGHHIFPTRDQWRALIATLESLLRLHRHRAGSLVRMDEYLYRRSGGMIGSLSQLVRGAAILAIEDGSEQITKDLLDTVPVDYAAERANTALHPGTGRRPASKPVPN